MVGPILIAGEDVGRRNRLSAALIGEGYRVIEAESGYRTLDLLRRRSNIMLAVIELAMSDINGVNFIANLRSAGIRVPLIAVAGAEDDVRLSQALEAGANDYLILPISDLRLHVSISNLLQHKTLEREVHVVRRYAEDHLCFNDLTTKSQSMQLLVQDARRAISNDKSILIAGEDGTGRETLARIIHHENNKRQGGFMRIQCMHLAEDAQSAERWKKELEAKISDSDGGTIFLSDVDMLDVGLQTYLVGLLEQNKRRNNATSNPFRLVATTTSVIDDLVHEGSFNLRLYSLLASIRLNIPPLRTRREDIADIANLALTRIVSETGQVRVSGISGAAQAVLLQHDWPGNISELENLLFRAVLLSEGPLLSVQDFPQLVLRQPEAEPVGQAEARIIPTDVMPQLFFDDGGHIRPLSMIERLVIDAAMRRYRGKISEVARRLQIGRSTLYRKLEEQGLVKNG